MGNFKAFWPHEGLWGIVGAPCGPIVGLEAPELPYGALGSPSIPKNAPLANGALGIPEAPKMPQSLSGGCPLLWGPWGPYWAHVTSAAGKPKAVYYFFTEAMPISMDAAI